MSEPTLLPLEKVFQKKAENSHELHDHRDNLFSRYIAVYSYLKAEIYKDIDVGLATLSQDNGIYTSHNAEHFDEVVTYAGELLGCIKGDEDLESLNAYELFVLLVAIRIHDAGNMYGRENHEKRAFQILSDVGNATMKDNSEIKFISDIAKAHGGKEPNGTKDTIGKTLEPENLYGKIEFRPQLIAAVVRFADEICESQNRAAKKLLEAGKLDKKNEVFHKYASSVKAVRVKRIESRNTKSSPSIEITLKFEVDVKDCLKTWGKTENGNTVQIYLIDEIFNRLEKMILERRYCNHFMRDVCNVVSIKANIEIFESVNIHGFPELHTLKKIPIIEKAGYPKSNNFLSEMCNIDGKKLKQELKKKV